MNNTIIPRVSIQYIKKDAKGRGRKGKKEDREGEEERHRGGEQEDQRHEAQVTNV